MAALFPSTITVSLNNDYGNIYCSGGQLGDGTTTNRSSPVLVKAGAQNPSSPDSPLVHIKAISAGEGHSLALDANSTVLAWGDNTYGQLGDGTTTRRLKPVRVIKENGNPLSHIISISAGYLHSLAIDVNGVIWSWGFKDYGGLGLDRNCGREGSLWASLLSQNFLENLKI